jgi:hypothetical protein
MPPEVRSFNSSTIAGHARRSRTVMGVCRLVAELLLFEID